MKTLAFTVDSALLRELGERLVGRPHIALGELIKNAYDADATKVVVRLGQKTIEVIDNGHGMTFDEFKHFWMRVGSPHKQSSRTSRGLHRSMTGSKGIGRLSVQFLAEQIELRTRSNADPAVELTATVDWREAVKAGSLTQAVARYRKVRSHGSGSANAGTTILLSRLRHRWTTTDVQDLAREVWWLQPPFRPNPTARGDRGARFEVVIETEDGDLAEAFDTQMRALLDIWHAKIVGELRPPKEPGGNGRAKLSLSFDDDTKATAKFSIPDCALGDASFEIRIYSLQHRQRTGIRVQDAREYLNRYGGVHVYDAGFHLPYYGPDVDWLGTEQDHAHRLSRSKLLPDALQVSHGLNFLPTNSRIIGIVNVDTGIEQATAANRRGKAGPPPLMIQVSRDRLVDNAAYKSLRFFVRWALDYYAMQEAGRALELAARKRPVEPTSDQLARVEAVLESRKDDLEPELYKQLRVDLRAATIASRAEEQHALAQVGMLGPLATAGVAALAYEHEVAKQLQRIDDFASQLRRLRVAEPVARSAIESVAAGLTDWVARARATRSLFGHLLDDENRDVRARMDARGTLEQIVRNMHGLLRGVAVGLDGIDPGLLLPSASFAEWTAVFQNVILNAVNAMADSATREIAILSRGAGRRRAIIVQDRGIGVDRDTAGELFQPFVRRLNLSPERRRLGLGGSGLGLSIVRMIADGLSCNVGFVEPALELGFNTAFELSWSETQ